MWSNAPKEVIQHSLPPPELCSWTKKQQQSYSFEWECPSIQELIKETVTFLQRGAAIRKGVLHSILDVGKVGIPVDLAAVAKTAQISSNS